MLVLPSRPVLGRLDSSGFQRPRPPGRLGRDPPPPLLNQSPTDVLCVREKHTGGEPQKVVVATTASTSSTPLCRSKARRSPVSTLTATIARDFSGQVCTGSCEATMLRRSSPRVPATSSANSPMRRNRCWSASGLSCHGPLPLNSRPIDHRRRGPSP